MLLLVVMHDVVAVIIAVVMTNLYSIMTLHMGVIRRCASGIMDKIMQYVSHLRKSFYLS